MYCRTLTVYIPYRVIRRIQIEGNSKFHGSGSIVSCNGKFYLLTCCHNFLKKADGDNLQHLEDNCIEKEMKAKCKRAKYLFSTRDSTGDFKSTVALKADVVLTNREDPVLIFDKVNHSWQSPLSCLICNLYVCTYKGLQ